MKTTQLKTGKDFNRQFIKARYSKRHKHGKNVQPHHLVISQMQKKTMMGNHYIPTQWNQDCQENYQ